MKIWFLVLSSLMKYGDRHHQKFVLRLRETFDKPTFTFSYFCFLFFEDAKQINHQSWRHNSPMSKVFLRTLIFRQRDMVIDTEWFIKITVRKDLRLSMSQNPQHFLSAAKWVYGHCRQFWISMSLLARSMLPLLKTFPFDRMQCLYRSIFYALCIHQYHAAGDFFL